MPNATNDELFFFQDINSVAHITINGLMVLTNAILLNQLILKNTALKEGNYIPGVIYILFMSSFKEAFLVSGSLFSITFLLFSLFLILAHVKQRASEENIFFTGFFLGLASILFKPLMSIFLLLVIVYFLYTRTIVRRYILSLYGFIFPHIAVYLSSIFLDISFDYSLGFNWNLHRFSEINMLTYSPIVLTPFLLITLYGLFKNYAGRQMTNHQIHFQRVMTGILIYSSCIFFITESAGALLISILPITFFISMTIEGIQKPWLREVVSLLLIILLAVPYL
jgi:hypothetical protein